MNARQAASVGLAVVALGVGAWALVGTLRCGMMSVEASEPGAPPAEGTCVGVLHPGALLATAAGAAGVLLAGWGHRAALLGVGAAMTLVGLAVVLSLGLWGVAVGALLLASAAAAPSARDP